MRGAFEGFGNLRTVVQKGGQGDDIINKIVMTWCSKVSLGDLFIRFEEKWLKRYRNLRNFR